ncbi:MAG: hypothetical protein LBS79_06360 [Tannerella sp.]|jgi:hypothetical protein|nr:hypothetical protein [Tannerella sp.]
MATKANYNSDNPQKDKKFEKFVHFLLVTLVLGGIGIAIFANGSDGTLFLVCAGITGILSLYNCLMYKHR